MGGCGLTTVVYVSNDKTWRERVQELLQTQGDITVVTFSEVRGAKYYTDSHTVDLTILDAKVHGEKQDGMTLGFELRKARQRVLMMLGNERMPSLPSIRKAQFGLGEQFTAMVNALLGQPVETK